jgi:Uma2 family endonuclease
MSSRDPLHNATVVYLTQILIRRGDWIVSVHNPLRLDAWSEPVPDIVLLHPEVPQDRHPTPEHTHLVIEVAGRTLGFDRRVRGPLYARTGVPEYWIVDINGERIEVHRAPSEAGYRASRFYLRGESLSPAFAPDLTVQADAILGPIESPGG